MSGMGVHLPLCKDCGYRDTTCLCGKQKRMPKQKPGKSVQEVATPKDFLDAVRNRLLSGEQFDYDLAADASNHVCLNYITEEEDALTKNWFKGPGWCWLNPPYSNITPWAKKAWEESRFGAKIAVLVPASTGSNWWRDWVDGKAYITYLNGRITFVGHTSPYPKDLALLLYAPYLEGGSTNWKWKG